MEVGQGEKVLTEAKINDSHTWWISATMTDQETCLDGLGREKSRSIALVWRGRESVNDGEKGLGFFFFFFLIQVGFDNIHTLHEQFK